jgi:predicted MFS family arabinose efflux permease
MSDFVQPVAAGAVAASNRGARYYTLGLLTIIYALNFLDRTIFNVLIEPIKKEFALTDTAIGLLAGFGFVLFYSILGIPVARFADRRNRRNVIAVGVAFWSAMTALCGAAQSVTTLALARIGVGIGESAGTPASQSLISELFGKDERPRALGIFAIGTYLGVFLGYFLGGWVNQYYGWRTAFIAAGVPGIGLALLLWACVGEPQAANAHGRSARAPREAIGAAFRFLMSQRSYALVLVGFCCTSFANFATSVWIAPFLARVHRLSSGDIGTYAGTFKGLFGIAGTLLGGFIVARISRDEDRWKLWAPAGMSALAGPVFGLSVLTPSFPMAIAALGLFSLLVGFHLGPIFAIAQTVAKPNMRAFAAATLLLTATCFGQGVGPLVVGIITDALFPMFGRNAIRYSLLSAAGASMLGALAFLVAATSLRDDMRRTGER